MSNHAPFDTRLVLKLAQDLVTDIAQAFTPIDPTGRAYLKARLEQIDDALYIGSRRIGHLETELEEAQTGFGEAKHLAADLMDALAQQAKQGKDDDKALYDMAECLFFLLSARMDA